MKLGRAAAPGVPCGFCGIPTVDGNTTPVAVFEPESARESRILMAGDYRMPAPAPTRQVPICDTCSSGQSLSGLHLAARLLGLPAPDADLKLAIEGREANRFDPTDRGQDAFLRIPMYFYSLPEGTAPNAEPFGHVLGPLRAAYAEATRSRTAPVGYPAGCSVCRVDRQDRRHGSFADVGRAGILCHACKLAHVEASNLPLWTAGDIALADWLGDSAVHGWPGWAAQLGIEPSNRFPATPTRFEFVDRLGVVAASQRRDADMRAPSYPSAVLAGSR